MNTLSSDELRAAGESLYGNRWQTALARRLCVDPSTVRRWLAGAPIPGIAAVAISLLKELKELKQ